MAVISSYIVVLFARYKVITAAKAETELDHFSKCDRVLELFLLLGHVVYVYTMSRNMCIVMSMVPVWKYCASHDTAATVSVTRILQHAFVVFEFVQVAERRPAVLGAVLQVCPSELRELRPTAEDVVVRRYKMQTPLCQLLGVVYLKQRTNTL